MTSAIADYELLSEIGQGNFGVYYLAHPPARLPVEDEYVAVKLFGSGTRVNPTTFRHAVNELRAFGAVGSPYLVRLLDAGQEQGAFYYAMDYHERGSLANPREPLTTNEALRALADAAEASHHLHEAGIVHRDIKPSNVLLTADGGRLSDLGLAQVLAPGLTVTSFGGSRSLNYLDPAILRGARPSRASDIWALGVSIHQTLTGEEIYPDLPAGDLVAAMRKLATTAPKISASLAPAAAALVRRCLDSDPAARPSTALAVAEELKHLSADPAGHRHLEGKR